MAKGLASALQWTFLHLRTHPFLFSVGIALKELKRLCQLIWDLTSKYNAIFLLEMYYKFELIYFSVHFFINWELCIHKTPFATQPLDSNVSTHWGGYGKGFSFHLVCHLPPLGCMQWFCTLYLSCHNAPGQKLLLSFHTVSTFTLSPQ